MSKALVYTAVFSLLITPADFRLAKSVGAIDIPKDARRMHTRPIPRLGGISIFASFVILCLFLQKEIAPDFLFVLSGAFFITVLGVTDDALGLSAKFKLTAQVLISATVAFGISYFEDWNPILIPLGIVWLLTLINAHNFIDGLNGLCAGIAIIESFALGVLFILGGNTLEALVCFILCGACVGFLPYNSPKAKLFMGDTGSTFIGFTLGVLSLELLNGSNGFADFCSVILILIFPLIDISFAVTRRILKGQSPFVSDRSHIHHFIADRVGHRQASVLIRISALISATLGILLYLTFSS